MEVDLAQETCKYVCMVNDDITKEIIRCAYKVYNTMGFGFLESVYEKCLLLELEASGLTAEAQIPIEVLYEGKEVGNFVADLIVAETVIIELKSVTRLVRAHEVQLVNYLVATKKDIGLLINFGEKGVEVKRKTRQLPGR